MSISRMLRSRTTVALTIGAAAVATLAACTDGPSAPRQAPSAAPRLGIAAAPVDSVTTAVQGLLWSKPVKEDTASKVIGPKGGSLSVGNLKLVVPKGAVTTNTTFSVTRIGGRIVAYEFQPHGTTFQVPVQLEFETKDIDWSSLSGATHVAGAHFLDASTLDQATGTAVVDEFVPTIVAVDKSKVTMTVPHFSGYMVSTGRRR
jgi:hypothetical protein